MTRLVISRLLHRLACRIHPMDNFRFVNVAPVEAEMLQDQLERAGITVELIPPLSYYAVIRHILSEYHPGKLACDRELARQLSSRSALHSIQRRYSDGTP